MTDQHTNVEAIYPLSPVQEGILFHVLESGNSGAYFLQFTCSFAAPVDSVRLRTSWQSAVDRHAVLRTLCTWERRERPLQVVRKRAALPWHAEDWTVDPPEDLEARWQSLLARDRRHGFNLDDAPLLRVVLIRASESEYRMLVSAHHIIIDGWSMRLILDEVVKQYRGESLADVAGIPTYREFVGWLDTQDIASTDSYWQATLAGLDEPTLPFFIRSGGNRVDHEVVSLKMSSELSASVSQFARAHQLTTNTMVLGAWALVLGQAAESDDVLFGTTVAGRPADLAGINQTAGLFINTLPLRIRIEFDRAPDTWLRDIQANQLAARRFEHAALTRIARCSSMPPGTTMFQTIVVVENIPDTPALMRDRPLRPLDQQFIEYSNYPLALLVFPNKSLELLAVYNPVKIRREVALQLLHLVVNALTGLSSNANSLREVTLVSQTDRDRVVNHFNGRFPDTTDTLAVHQQFEQAVVRNPDAVALRSESTELTYRALNAEANELASKLIEAGVTRGMPVPLIVERSPGAIIAMLAVLKAGGAFLPIDPRLSAERIREMLSDLACLPITNPPVIVTDRALENRLYQLSVSVLVVNGLKTCSVELSNPDVMVDSEQLAYVIYTSGSTGRSKGVMITHANLTASTAARLSFYLTAPERFLLLSPITTDSAMAGIWWTLTTGATLVVPSPYAEQNIDALVSWMSTERVTHTLCIPSLYRVLLEQTSENLDLLNTVIVAAEACDQTLSRLHYERFPNTLLVNEYGPTETTVWATAGVVQRDKQITIGKPVANARIYVLDSWGRPLPVGWPGELYIGGAGVGSGYLNQQEETAARFVEDPFSGHGRLYKTGDLVQWLADGRLLWLGRIDNQLKIRGYRIEPEEIEQFLLGCDGVKEAAVVLHHDKHIEPTADELASVLGEMDDRESLLMEIENMPDSEVLETLDKGVSSRTT